MFNVWQGAFPSKNTLGDGYLGTAPVAAFRATGLRLHHRSADAPPRHADEARLGQFGLPVPALDYSVVKEDGKLCAYAQRFSS